MATNTRPSVERASDKEKALETALLQIERQFGKGSVMRLGEETRVPVEVIPTGSIALDVALGLGGLPRGRIVEIYGPESSGKCLTAETYVWSDRGLETIAEVFERAGMKASCTSRVTDVSESGIRLVNENGELETVAALTHNNRKPVLRLKLRSGRTVSVTHNHPLRVVSDRGFIVWRKAGEVQVGDTVVSAEFGAVAAAAGDGLSEDEAVLLGYLVAEGTLCYENCVRFTNCDPEVSGEFTRLMEHIAGVPVRNYGDKEFSAQGKKVREQFAKGYGLDYVRAAGKKVPLCVRVSGHKAQRAFLSALFEGDGWIDPTSTIGLGTASGELARQVQLMLYGLGIPATVSSKYNPKYERDYWSVTVNPAVVGRFLSEVGFRSARRRAQVERCFKPSPRDPQFENIPHLSGLLRDLRDDCGGDRGFDRATGDIFRKDTDLSCSRQRLAKIVEWCDRQEDRFSAGAKTIVKYLRILSALPYTYEEVVAVGELVVDADVEVVLVQALLRIDKIVVAVDVDVRLRIQGRDGGGCGTDRAGASDRENIGWGSRFVDCNRHAAETQVIEPGALSETRIEDLALIRWISAAVHDACYGRTEVEEAGEIPAELSWTRNHKKLRQRLTDAQAFVIDEEEGAILDEGPAESGAELVLLVLRPSEEVESVASIELFVAQEFVQVTVESIGAGLDDGIHDGAVAAAELGTVGVGLDLEFTNGVDGGLDDVSTAIEDVAEIGVVVDAIEQKVILQGTGAIGTEAPTGLSSRSRLAGGDAGRELGKLGEVPSIQRECGCRLSVDHLTQF